MRKVPSDRILVTPLEDEKPSHGLFVATKVKQSSKRGIVEAVGVDVIEVSVGDVVVFGQHSGNALTLDNKLYVLLREPEIYVINP